MCGDEAAAVRQSLDIKYPVSIITSLIYVLYLTGWIYYNFNCWFYGCTCFLLISYNDFRFVINGT